MTSFRLPAVCTSFTTTSDSLWGPPLLLLDVDDNNPQAATYDSGNIGKFLALPYAPFGRSDRLGRAADFTAPQGHHQGRYGGGDYQRNNFRDRGFQQNRYDRNSGAGAFPASYQQYQQIQEQAQKESGEEAFQLVDTVKAGSGGGGGGKRFVNPNLKRRQHSQRLRQVNARRAASTGGGAGAGGAQLDKMSGLRGGRSGLGTGGRGNLGGGGGGRGSFGGRGGFGGGGRGGFSGRGGIGFGRVDRQPSVAVQNDWKSIDEVDLGKMNKNLHATMMTVPKSTDILWCGFLDSYNDLFDKVSARQPVPLKRVETKEFYPVTTTDDPVLEKLAIDGVGQVFITDTILAHLMTCTRSVFPWDIVVQKLPNGTLFFDKRDNSSFDFLTVHETAYHPPNEHAEDEINAPERLGLEATMIHQNFSQQILAKKGPRKDFELPNPFFDEDDHEENMEPASVAFRYRSFALDDQTTVVCRTELHGIVKGTQYMTAFALNEYMPSASAAPSHNPATSMSWRDKIDSQRGAVLATELKNNSFKLAKWTAQSILASADQMKIGFVSRVSPKNAYEHVILATQFYRPKDFATQITLQEGNMWALFRFFVNLFQKQEEGKYVLMRDPNHPQLKVYRVPPETFEDDE